MLGILLFVYDSVHSGLAPHGMKKYSPYYRNIAHSKRGIEDRLNLVPYRPSGPGLLLSPETLQ